MVFTKSISPELLLFLPRFMVSLETESDLPPSGHGIAIVNTTTDVSMANRNWDTLFESSFITT